MDTLIYSAGIVGSDPTIIRVNMSKEHIKETWNAVYTLIVCVCTLNAISMDDRYMPLLIKTLISHGWAEICKGRSKEPSSPVMATFYIKEIPVHINQSDPRGGCVTDMTLNDPIIVRVYSISSDHVASSPEDCPIPDRNHETRKSIRIKISASADMKSQKELTINRKDS